MCQRQALASCGDERWAAKISQGQGFRIRIGTQEQQAPSGRRLGRLNGDNRRQAAHRLTESVAATTITTKVGGGGRRGLLAPDYVPVQGGRPSTRLPFAVLQPKRREVPQQPAVLRCPEHDWPAWALCRERRREVRNCCKRGHHTAAHLHRLQSRGLCEQHEVGACARCKVNKQSVPYCCGHGHHGGVKQKPGPKPAAPDEGLQAPPKRRLVARSGGADPPTLVFAGHGEGDGGRTRSGRNRHSSTRSPLKVALGPSSWGND